MAGIEGLLIACRRNDGWGGDKEQWECSEQQAQFVPFGMAELLTGLGVALSLHLYDIQRSVV